MIKPLSPQLELLRQKITQGGDIKEALASQTLMLALSCALAAGCLSSLYRYVAPMIEANRIEQSLAMLRELVPDAEFSPSLFETAQVFEIEERAYQVVTLNDQSGQPTYQVLSGAEPGYSGDIRFMVAVDFQGVIQNVRVLSHSETPGLGDKIELAKSDWILSFNHRSLSNTTLWQVEKDGGVFEQFSGATITPRALVRGVHQALLAHALIQPMQTKEAIDE